VLRLIPGLERAEFLQFGQIHRNTYINGPRVLAATMQMRSLPMFSLPAKSPASKVCRIGGDGWLAGLNAARLLRGKELLIAPPRSAIGALARYVSSAETKNYQPVNITFALLQPLTAEQSRSVRRKRDRHSLQVNLALEEWNEWLQHLEKKELTLVAD